MLSGRSVTRSLGYLAVRGKVACSELVPTQKEHTFPHFIGLEPGTLLPIYARSILRQRFLQVGIEERDRRYYPVPKFHSIISLEEALELISLPKPLGVHPELNKNVILEVVDHELALRIDDTRLRHVIGGRLKVTNVTLERAVTMMAAPERSLPCDGRLGEYNGRMVHILSGADGYYIRYGSLNVPIFTKNPGAFTLNDAIKALMSFKEKVKKNAQKNGPGVEEVDVLKKNATDGGVALKDW